MPPTVALVLAQPPMGSLLSAWEKLYWSVEARGPLLLIGGEEPGRGELPAPPPSGYNAVELAAHFDRVLVRCGAVTTIATRTMRLYDPPRTPTALATQLRDINPEPYWLLLLASLTSSQRQEATSDQGLSLRLLDTRQSRWLESALPESVRFRLTRQGTPSRQTLRLHLSRQLDIEVFAKGRSDSSFEPTGMNEAESVGAVTLTLREPVPPADDEAVFLGRQVVPGKVKPTDLSPSSPALDAAVALEGASSVKALMARLARATGLTLLADAPLGELPVRTRGKSARVGDVLAALCRGVNGGMRRIGSVYLLVEELPTAAERRERANADYQRFLVPQEQEVQQLSQLAAAARRRLIKDGILREIPRSSQDVPGVLWAQAERFDSETRTPLVQLTPALRDELATLFELQKALVERFGGTLPMPPAEAKAQQKLVLELLTPEGAGRVQVAELSAESLRQDQPLPEPPGPLVIPKTLATRAWQVALPESEEQQKSLITLAKSRSITELRVPVRPGDESALGKLASAAKLEKIGVVPVFSPLIPFSAKAPREHDATGKSLAEWALSRTSDTTPGGRLAQTLARWEFVTPEALDSMGVVAFAKRLSALPGITGLALDGLAPPGYPDAEPGDWPLWWGGFSLEPRLNFLLTQGRDPADLVPPSPFAMGRGGAELFEVWQREQRQRRDQALSKLQMALKAATLPVPLSVRAGNLGKSGHWQRWRGAVPSDDAPFDILSGVRPPLVPDEARPGLLHISVLAYDARVSGLGAQLDTLFDPDARLRDWLDMELQPATRPTPDHPDHWDGFVVDVSDRSLGAALLLLEKAFSGQRGT